MVKKFRSRLAGVVAGLMVVSSIGHVIPAFADVTDPATSAQTVEVNGFTLERENETSQWTVVSFDGSTTEAIIPDAVSSDGSIIDNPEKVIPESVMYIEESVFDEMSNVASLKLPKYLNKIIKNKTDDTTSKILNKLVSLEAFESNNEGNMFYTYDGALYAGNKIISYPQMKTGNYSIKEGTTSADERAFNNTTIDTLTIPNGFVVDNQKEDGYYKYTFLASSIDYFEGPACASGSLFDDSGRLIAYGNNSDANLSDITSANPYAFQSEEILLNSTLPENIRKSVPFSFYSGEDKGKEFQTRYFNIDGKTAYCYNHGKLNPETVGDLSDYYEAISNESTRKKVTAILFAGYPNDAYGLLDSSGVETEAAKNITGSLVWEAVDGVGFDMNTIYGIEDMDSAEEYYSELKQAINSVEDSAMEDFELKFYSPKENVQGLVVIHKISRPDIPDDPVITKPSLLISKRDIITKEELPGAKLKVTKDDVVIDEWVSTSEKHELKDLEDGDYTLVEVTAPDGYEMAESISFSVENGKVSTNEIIMYDAPIIEDIIISKQDATTRKELPGAKIELYRDEVLIDTWVSTSKVHIIASPSNGTYVLKEVTAPKGYEVAESITFEVEDGKVTPNPVIMYDKPEVENETEPETTKHHNGGWSGGGGDGGPGVIITTPIPETSEEIPTTEIPAIEDRPNPVTGDIGGIVEIILMLMTAGGSIIYGLYKLRKKGE